MRGHSLAEIIVLTLLKKSLRSDDVVDICMRRTGRSGAIYEPMVRADKCGARLTRTRSADVGRGRAVRTHARARVLIHRLVIRVGFLERA